MDYCYGNNPLNSGVDLTKMVESQPFWISVMTYCILHILIDIG